MVALLAGGEPAGVGLGERVTRGVDVGAGAAVRTARGFRKRRLVAQARRDGERRRDARQERAVHEHLRDATIHGQRREVVAERRQRPATVHSLFSVMVDYTRTRGERADLAQRRDRGRHSRRRGGFQRFR